MDAGGGWPIQATDEEVGAAGVFKNALVMNLQVSTDQAPLWLAVFANQINQTMVKNKLAEMPVWLANACWEIGGHGLTWLMIFPKH